MKMIAKPEIVKPEIDEGVGACSWKNNFVEYMKMFVKPEIVEGVVTCSWKNKFVEYMEKFVKPEIVKPEIGLLFSGATMQNIYQLTTSEVVTTSKGKTLMKMNEAAFMMLLYGLFMPRRAAGHVALTCGVALASAAYLLTLSFAF